MLFFPGGFVYSRFRAHREKRHDVLNNFSPFDIVSFPHEWMQLLSKWRSVDSAVNLSRNFSFADAMELTWIFSTWFHGATDDPILTPGMRPTTLILSSWYLVPRFAYPRSQMKQRVPFVGESVMKAVLLEIFVFLIALARCSWNAGWYSRFSLSRHWKKKIETIPWMKSRNWHGIEDK